MSKEILKAKIKEQVPGIAGVTAEAIVQTILETIVETTKEAGVFAITGFGTFKTVTRDARKGRNPQTGKEINIPAKKIVKFTVGKKFRDSVEME